MKKQVYLFIFFTVLCISCEVTAKQILSYYINNSIRDNTPADDIPDELASYAVNYVVKQGWIGSSPDRFWESRVYVEFPLSFISESFTHAELNFTAFRNNAPHIPDQVVEVYGYPGDGQITLDDWYEAGDLISETDPIKGFEEDGSNKGEPIVFSGDISVLFSTALNEGWSHLGIFFKNPQISYVYSSDPLGYSSLVTVGRHGIDLSYKPIADAGADQTAYAFVDGYALVKLDGSNSHDMDGDELEYYWYNDTSDLIATGAEPNIVFGVGEYEVTLIVNDGIEDSEPNSCIVTVFEALEAKAKLTPQSLNRKSHRPHVIGRLELSGYTTPDPDPDLPMILMPGNIVAHHVDILDSKKKGNSLSLQGHFDNNLLMDTIEQDGDVEVTIAAQLLTGQWVYGTDIVKVK